MIQLTLNPYVSKLQDEHQAVIEILKELRLITNGFEPVQQIFLIIFFLRIAH
ncbi:hypothetical protein ABH892_004931 [Paenibacillus sp. RC254]|nr:MULTISPECIES: hypothetical protein [unclassified Paenibacillus]